MKKNRNQIKGTKLSAQKLPISVTVCTYNQEENIKKCIETLRKNRPSEIIVIDGGSSDNTVAIAKKMGARVVQTKKGLSSQRQAGIIVARQKYTAIVDADNILEPDCLSKLLRELQQNKFAAIQTEVVPYKPTTYWESAKASSYVASGDLPKETNMVGRPALYTTASLRKVGFDAFFDRVGGEDANLSRGFEKAGFRQGLGTGRAFEKYEKKFSEHFKKWRRYGKGDAHFAYKYPERKKNILRHQLINYPIIKSINAIKRGTPQYAPYYFLTGTVRFIYFVPEYIRLLVTKGKP